MFGLIMMNQSLPLHRYVFRYILKSMKIGERGQVTVPKEIRDRFGLFPATEVEFRIENGSIVLKKSPKKLALDKWTGYCAESLSELGVSSVDESIDELRGE